MNFFKPEDFKFENPIGIYGYDKMAEIANAKLEREGKVVYASESGKYATLYGEDKNKYTTHQAILLNVESIEKCTHPKEKVVHLTYGPYEKFVGYQCECGAKLKPTKFEEMPK